MSETDIAVEIGSLAGLDLSVLRDRWRALYGSEPPPRMSRELLVRAIAYRIQENAFGGVSRAARAKLASVSSSDARDRVRRIRTDRRTKPGTKFLREWNGRTHEVVAMADGGFLYRGIAYRSLSAIAREITGTRWSGPAFFGLDAGKGSVREDGSGRSKVAAGNTDGKRERANASA